MHESQKYKPVVLLDDRQFWDPLSEFIDLMVNSGFIASEHRNIVASSPSVKGALQLIKETTLGGMA